MARCGAVPELAISDGTTTVWLEGGRNGIYVEDWRPALPQAKGGGVWRDSPLSDGSRLAMERLADAIETITITVVRPSQDAAIRDLTAAFELLLKAKKYWPTPTQDEPVYLVKRAAFETNLQYSIIKGWQTPDVNNPFANPFFGPDNVAYQEVTLVIQREPAWHPHPPGRGECVPASAMVCHNWPRPMDFNNGAGSCNCANPLKLQNLPDFAVAGKGQITVDGYVQLRSWGHAPPGHIATKTDGAEPINNGWRFYVDAAGGLCAEVACGNATALSASGLDEFALDDDWHYVLFCYDETGADTPVLRLIYLNIDGTWVASYAPQVPSAGNYSVDTALNYHIGWLGAIQPRVFDGCIGWLRVSNNIRYAVGVDFTPPPRCALPADDANTMWLGGHDASSIAGFTAHDVSAAPQNCATAWVYMCGEACSICTGSVLGDCGPAYLEFDGDRSVVTCAAGLGTIDNLPQGANGMTWEGWYYADTAGEGNAGAFTKKGNNCEFRFTAAGQVTFTVTYAVGASAAIYAFVPDGAWHHWGCTFNENTDRTAHLWFDGALVASGAAIPAGAYLGDAATALTTGNDVAGAQGFDGGAGWVRGSDTVRYAANFTPPPRCTLPTIDANTVLQIIYEGQGNLTYDMSTNNNHGTISNCNWACDCYPTSVYSGEVLTGATREPTCEDEVYHRNAGLGPPITNVHYWDSALGVWSENLVTAALPTPLFPPVPVAADFLLIGIDSNVYPYGAFNNVMFDLAQQGGLSTTGGWKYSRGAADPTGWPALTSTDETDWTIDNGYDATARPLRNEGVCGLFFAPPTDWSNAFDPQVGVGAALGVTGYWIALDLTSGGAGHTAPLQQNRHVYTVTWGYTQFEGQDIGGDLGAIARHIVRNRSDQALSAASPWAYDNRIICGLRSVERGEDFNAFLNVMPSPANDHDHNPAGVSFGITPIISAAVLDPTAAGGYHLAVTNVPGIWTRVGWWDLETDIATQYYGRYHAFLRVDQTSGAAGDLQVKLAISQLNVDTPSYATEPRTISSLARTIVDLGLITLPPGSQMLRTDKVTELFLEVYGSGNGASDFNIYDLVLIPADELILKAINDPAYPIQGAGGLFGETSQFIDIDGLTAPKYCPRALVRYQNNVPGNPDWEEIQDAVLAGWLYDGASPPALTPGTTQRLWWLGEEYVSVASGWYCEQFPVRRVQTQANASYLLARGAE